MASQRKPKTSAEPQCANIAARLTKEGDSPPVATTISSQKLNGSYSSEASALETAQKTHWAIDALQKGWPIFVVTVGLIFAAGKMSAKLDVIVEKQQEQAKAMQIDREKVDARFAKSDAFEADMRVWTARVEEHLSLPLQMTSLPSPSKRKPVAAAKKAWSLFR